MKHVLLLTYSRFVDSRSGVELISVLDRRSGCFVAHAEVEDEAAKQFVGRPNFEVLTPEEFLAATSMPPRVEPTEPMTGDPLGDEALGGQADNGNAPPAPPSGEAKAPKKPAKEAAPPAPPV